MCRPLACAEAATYKALLSTAVSTNYEVLGGGGDFVLPPQYSLRYRNDEEFPLSTLDATSTFANDAPAGAEDAPTMP